jgi:hypothetical protein
MQRVKDSACCFMLLSQLVLKAERSYGLTPVSCCPPSKWGEEEISEIVASFDIQDFAELWLLAESHHVLLRAFPSLQSILAAANDRSRWPEWVENAIAEEKARIRCAANFLSSICQALEEAGKVIVIKSLDHWPDLGSDLDVFTNANIADVIAIMCERFRAKWAQRSWGDRLANKWNFIVPGLPEMVEIHVARLGQTGEQVAMTESLIERASAVQFGRHMFRVPAAEDRIIISTLQRMYRHFYIRLCDIVDNAQLIASDPVDYFYLHSLAHLAGVWEGVASYLVVVSDYVRVHCGTDLPLPSVVTDAARFGSERIRFRRKFLRIPVFPDAASLYLSEWKRLMLNGELRNALRLALLPGLAAAAALEFTITGSDKGTW